MIKTLGIRMALFSAEGFFLLLIMESFSLLKGVAHPRCVLRLRARQIGELALIDAWHQV